MDFLWPFVRSKSSRGEQGVTKSDANLSMTNFVLRFQEAFDIILQPFVLEVSLCYSQILLMNSK